MLNIVFCFQLVLIVCTATTHNTSEKRSNSYTYMHINIIEERSRAAASPLFLSHECESAQRFVRVILVQDHAKDLRMAMLIFSVYIGDTSRLCVSSLQKWIPHHTPPCCFAASGGGNPTFHKKGKTSNGLESATQTCSSPSSGGAPCAA